MANRNRNKSVRGDIAERFEENLNGYREETGGISWRDRLASLRSRDISTRRTYAIGGLVALIGGVLGFALMRRRRPLSQGQMIAKRLRNNARRRSKQMAKDAKLGSSFWSRA